MSYDSAITVFSPDGRLYQVEYALEAVQKGATAVGVLGRDCVVLAAEKKNVPKLQDARTVQKIVALDENVLVAFAGLTADARVLIDRARVEAQSYRLTVEDAPTPEYLTRWIARLQQRYTTQGGARPFGLATLVAGRDAAGAPYLAQTDPSGNWAAWRAHAIGHGAKTVREYLEKHYGDPAHPPARDAALALAIRALLEVVESHRNVEVAVVDAAAGTAHVLAEDEVARLVDSIQAEKEAAEAAEKARH